MELYVDTANIDHIRHAASLGFISGVTTNPSLLAKEDPSVDIKKRILEKMKNGEHTDHQKNNNQDNRFKKRFY